MHIMAEEKIGNALEVKEETVECKSKDWVCHSQAIAAIMSNRMGELSMTQRALAEKMNCTQQYVSVIRNLVQDRKCIRYQNIVSRNK